MSVGLCEEGEKRGRDNRDSKSHHKWILVLKEPDRKLEGGGEMW